MERNRERITTTTAKITVKWKIGTMESDGESEKKVLNQQSGIVEIVNQEQKQRSTTIVSQSLKCLGIL